MASVPVILQTELSECGLACLAMVLAAHGDQRGLAALRQASPISLRGARLDCLCDLAEAVGLTARPLRLELEELRALRCPAILHWNLQHFVVLVRCDRRGMVVHDPAQGRRRVSWREASRSFTGVALELGPDAGFEPVRVAPRVDWRRLIGPLPGLLSGLGRIAALALALEAVVLIGPLFMQGVIDHVLVSRDLGLLAVLGIAFLALLTFQAFATALRAWSMTTFTQQLSFAWQGRLFHHLLRLPIEYFSKRSLGEVLSRFGSLQTVQRTISSNLLEGLMDGLLACITLALMLMFSPALACVAVASLLLNLVLRLATVGVLHEHTERVIVAGARQQSHSVESMRGIESLRLCAGEQRRHRQWQDLNAEMLNEQLHLERVGLALRGATQWLVGAERIVVVWIAATMVLQQHFTVGALIAYLAYRDMFAGRAGMLIERVIELRLLRVHAARLADITEREPEPAPSFPSWQQLDELKLENCSFRYGDNEPWVVRGLSLCVRRGETVAIVGASGCGKSTLLRIIVGLLVPGEGHIEINGCRLLATERAALRRLCGVVMQDDQLFAGSVGENIAAFEADSVQERIVQAARLAAIHDDIASMPMAYDTTVGDMGSSLSGGQKQRVLLARALYRQPQLLLLDEATSHLDVASERLVSTAVRQLPCAKIIIAHRPETIASCDRVLVMENGAIIREYRPSLHAKTEIENAIMEAVA